MLDGLRQFIADVVSPTAHEDRKFDDTGYRLAATALLIHVISIDGEPTETEKRKLHSLIESRFGLDRGAAHLKDELMPKYAELIYNGFWFAPEREMLQAAIDHSQEKVSGTVRLKLYKGNANVVGRKSPNSLYSERHVTFEDDAGAYDQKDAAGFIKLNALRLKLLAKRDR